MKLSFVAIATSSFAIAAALAVAGGFQAGVAPEVPDHPLITAPVKASDVALFQDASTLWLADVLAAQGAQAKGKKTKFNETTIIHTSVFLSAFSESLVRHKEWVPASGRVTIVGGDPKDVRGLNASEFVALRHLFTHRLQTVPGGRGPNLVADENGVRGKLSLQEAGMTSGELRTTVREGTNSLSAWFRSR